MGMAVFIQFHLLRICQYILLIPYFLVPYRFPLIQRKARTCHRFIFLVFFPDFKFRIITLVNKRFFRFIIASLCIRQFKFTDF